jgi:hypothetical protein
MEINIVEEVYKLRVGLLETVNKNPLPTTIKVMVVGELSTALRDAEANEIRDNAIKKKELESVTANKKEE